jgi:3-deoxy-D-manno-octulosonic acid kinase
MTNGGRRIATATGAMLSDPACLGNLPQDTAESLFDPEFWRAREELLDVTGGRGSTWFIASGARQWALRHFRRGGFVARWSEDSYVWAGEDRVRAFAEWRLLDLLWQRGLPVPKPVAARYSRAGLCYRCDLITQRIVDAEPLSAALARSALSESLWRAVGATVARLHGAGVDHADLNAHNVLVGVKDVTVGVKDVTVSDKDVTVGVKDVTVSDKDVTVGVKDVTVGVKDAVSVIDFDRGRLRAQGAWSARNLWRLRRSLAKITHDLPPGRYSDETWAWLMVGYEAE